jgi:hypothetical protein
MKRLVLAVAVLLGSVLNSNATEAPRSSTQAGPAIAAVAAQSAKALATYLDSVAKDGARPDYTKAPAAELFQNVFDTQKLASLPPFKADDLSWVIEWNGAGNLVNIRMLWFGVQTKPAMDQVALKRNLTDYEDQVAMVADFMIRLQARQSGAMLQFLEQLPAKERTPIRMDGIKQARTGASEMIRGALVSVVQGMKPVNARLMTAALKDTSDIWSIFLQSEDRAEVMRVIRAVSGYITDAEVKANIASFGAVMTAAI